LDDEDDFELLPRFLGIPDVVAAIKVVGFVAAVTGYLLYLLLRLLLEPYFYML
jgi:hypothetical protein